MQAEAYVYKNFPKEIVCKRFSFLFLNRHWQVSILTVFHDYADRLLSNERVKVADYEMTIDFGHYWDFFHCFKRSFLWQHAYIDLFDNVGLVFK